MIRLFVALPLPETLRTHLFNLAVEVPGFRWIDPDRYHVTLRFIGEVDGARFEDIADELDRIVLDEIPLQLHGLGTFMEKRGQLVLWAGLRPSEPLARLQRKVESALVRLGLEPERRKFRPHVTMARIERGGEPQLARFLANRGDWLGDSFAANEFILYSSFLSPGGSLYREEAVYPLGDRLRALPRGFADFAAAEYASADE